jgi:hypothetical protein
VNFHDSHEFTPISRIHQGSLHERQHLQYDKNTKQNYLKESKYGEQHNVKHQHPQFGENTELNYPNRFEYEKQLNVKLHANVLSKNQRKSLVASKISNHLRR